MDVSSFTLVYYSLEVLHFLLSVEIHVKTNYSYSSIIGGSRNEPITIIIMDSSYVASFRVVGIHIAFVAISLCFKIACSHYQQN